jgi:nucleotide-binding universal stress UspA family protein
MIGTILASLTGSGSDRSVLDLAAALARIDGGHITCLHTRIDAVEAAVLHQGLSGRPLGGLQQVNQDIAQAEQANSVRALTEFKEACRRHSLDVFEKPGAAPGPSIAWKEVTTFRNETQHEARFHDIVVMGRDSELSQERIESVLMQGGRPVLIAPPRPVLAVGRRVAIGWKEGPEAARAIAAASGILDRAETIEILCALEDPAQAEAAVQSAHTLARQLSWGGIRAEVRTAHSGGKSAAETLREMAYNSEADLFLMGAYGHNRVREFVFGGVTRDFLADCAIPVLMFH